MDEGYYIAWCDAKAKPSLQSSYRLYLEHDAIVLNIN
jgi:hypothetical protein